MPPPRNHATTPPRNHAIKGQRPREWPRGETLLLQDVFARNVRSCPKCSQLPGTFAAFSKNWTKRTTIGQVSSITQRDGVLLQLEVADVRCLVSISKPGVQRFARGVRAKWAIKNLLH